MPGGAEAERRREQRASEQVWAFTAFTPSLNGTDDGAGSHSFPRLNPSARPPVRPADNQVLLLAPFLAPSLARSAPIMSI